MFNSLSYISCSGYCNTSDGKFTTAKVLVPQCLDLCNTTTIRRFFRKTWRYMDAYSKGLNAQQTAFAIKKYKSHRRVGLATEVIQLMEAQMALTKAPEHF
ncbi:hypothetical protein PILCRDRAFT_195617 [Piloderma croceum F 1598]|uniref:Uncharacterized protein n=1 Tax=Piloderma croceum (strain F 1598) TaxID=765440 RepID=A0A0C3GGK0_PILCF|nr:hypothetical protein PILCRDRAFT_195617 [Piloderma croceum F 1598]